MQSDTIVALSTTPGESGIGIIRLSGEESINIVNNIYTNQNGEKSLLKYKSHTIHYGFICNNDGEVIDEVMVSIMKAPNSYTKENVVEINCHGGIRLSRNILDLVISNGARIAEPGEFTKRAFLNGRLDLTKAEAVMDLIQSTSDLSLKSSINQLRGSLYTLLNNICSELKYEIAFIESALDDPDSISLDGYTDKLSEKIKEIKNKLSKLIQSYDEGKIISEGISTTILGKANAGKSSLLNMLLNEERAIVTDIPGTTRDTLTEKIKLGDIVLQITDTAGIRETDDPIEKIGVDKAKKSIDNSDLILYVFDSTQIPDEEDKKIISELKTKKVIVLFNKSDLTENTDHTQIEYIFINEGIKPEGIINTSFKTGEGIEELKDLINSLFIKGIIQENNQVLITNLRHLNHLKDAVDSLKKVETSIQNDMPEDFYTIDMTDAYASLAKITGSEVSEDIVNEIFSRFCMGK